MSSMSDVKDEAHFLIRCQFLVLDSHGFLCLYASRCISKAISRTRLVSQRG